MDRANRSFELNDSKESKKKSLRRSGLAKFAASTALVGAAFGVSACQDPDAQAEPGHTASPSVTETTTENPSPSLDPTTEPAETETTPVVAGETLPNGEPLLTSAEIEELRETEGDLAVTEYFTPTLDKLGMTAEEAAADPTEFGNRFGDLHSSYHEILYNMPAAINDQVTPGKQEDFIEYVGYLAKLTEAYRPDGDFENILRHAADVQSTTTLGGIDQLVEWTVEEDVSTTPIGPNTYNLDVSIHVKNDSILYDYVPKDAYKAYDSQELYTITATVNNDGTVSID